MKERILTNWTFSRALYLIMGIVIIIQAAIGHQWVGFVLGGYFASMGLFAFGCAAGNCFSSSCVTKPTQKLTNNLKDVDFEEVKIK